MIVKNIFIYHLDHELHKLFALDKAYSLNDIYCAFNRVTRLAFLLSRENLLIPASNYFESDIAFKIINSLNFLNQFGYIKFISSSYNLNDLHYKKIAQHGDNIYLSSYHYKDFLESQSPISLPGTLVKRANSASSDIKSAWLESIDDGAIWQELFKVSKSKKPSIFEKEISKMPSRLGDKAYISEYILPLLPIKEEAQAKGDSLINAFITKEYILSFLKEYKAVCMKDIPLIDSKIVLPDDESLEESHISYKDFAQVLYNKEYKNKRTLVYLDKCNGYELVEFKNSPIWQETINKLMEVNVVNSKIRNIKIVCGGEDVGHIKIGIITALPKEYVAMKKLIENGKEEVFGGKGAGHRFFIGEIPSMVFIK